MRASIVLLSTAVVAWAQRGVQQSLAFQNVADPITCGTLIQWTGGTASFTLKIQDTYNPDGVALKEFNSIAGHSFQWSIDLPSSLTTPIFLRLYDSAGTTADSKVISNYPGSCTNPPTTSSTTLLSTSSTSVPTTSASTSSSTSESSTTSSTPNTSSSTSHTPLTGGLVTYSATLPQDPASPSDTNNNSSSVTGDTIVGNSSNGTPASTSLPSNLAVIIGAAFGGLITLFIILVVLFLFIRRRRAQKATYHHHSTDPITSPYRPSPSIHSRTRLSEGLSWHLGDTTAYSTTGTPFTGVISVGVSGTVAVVDLPPAYEQQRVGRDEHHEGGVDEVEEESGYDELIGRFSASSRDLISPAQNATVATQAALIAPVIIDPLEQSIDEKRRRSFDQV